MLEQFFRERKLNFGGIFGVKFRKNRDYGAWKVKNGVKRFWIDSESTHIKPYYRAFYFVPQTSLFFLKQKMLILKNYSIELSLAA